MIQSFYLLKNNEKTLVNYIIQLKGRKTNSTLELGSVPVITLYTLLSFFNNKYQISYLCMKISIYLDVVDLKWIQL